MEFVDGKTCQDAGDRLSILQLLVQRGIPLIDESGVIKEDVAALLGMPKGTKLKTGDELPSDLLDKYGQINSKYMNDDGTVNL